MPSPLGSLARGGAGLMRPAVRAVGTAAARTGLMVGAAGLTFGAAAGVAALGGAYAVGRLATSIGGGSVFEGKTHDLFGKQIMTPTFTRGVNWGMGLGALGAGVAAGAADSARNGGWNVNHAISTGMLEVERPHFLGATGSLTIASSRRRRPEAEQGTNFARNVGMYGDDVLHIIRAARGH